MLLLAFLACPKGPAALEPGAPPRLPHPVSPTYVHAAEAARDPLVARAYPGPVDESLSGAASGLALALLASPALDPGELRWKAVLAGYPWPVVSAATARTAVDEVPADLVASATAAAGTHDVGLVRARGTQGDLWVLVLGKRRGEIPPTPREVPPGSELGFPGYAVRAATPGGDVVNSSGGIRVDFAGEWLVELADSEGVVATFPLYVGVRTPAAPPFSGAASAETAGDLDEELLLRLDALDAWYRRPAAERDPMLDGVARARLRDFAANKQLSEAMQQLAAGGFAGGDAGTCRGSTVAACLDAMWWSVDERAALITEAQKILEWIRYPPACEEIDGDVQFILGWHITGIAIPLKDALLDPVDFLDKGHLEFESGGYPGRANRSAELSNDNLFNFVYGVE